MDPEVIRWTTAGVATVAATLMIMFTIAEWERFRPRSVKAIMACFDAMLVVTVYSLGEAASQHAAFGLRTWLIFWLVVALIVILIVGRVRERR